MLNVSDPGEGGGWKLDVTIWSGESPQPQEQFSNLVSLRSVSSSLVQVLSSQFNKFKQTALLSDSPAVPSASAVRCDEAALAVITVNSSTQNAGSQRLMGAVQLYSLSQQPTSRASRYHAPPGSRSLPLSASIFAEIPHFPPPAACSPTPQTVLRITLFNI